jgi:hypothetical protein
LKMNAPPTTLDSMEQLAAAHDLEIIRRTMSIANGLLVSIADWELAELNENNYGT